MVMLESLCSKRRRGSGWRWRQKIIILMLSGAWPNFTSVVLIPEVLMVLIRLHPYWKRQLSRVIYKRCMISLNVMHLGLVLSKTWPRQRSGMSWRRIRVMQNHSMLLGIAIWMEQAYWRAWRLLLNGI